MLISVVIPTYNRLPILRKCLIALENQIWNEEIYNYEIVIVDDGSTDGTIDWLRNNIETFPHLRFFEQDHGGPALGRNLGVNKSKGDLIVFIDSDLVVDKYFLRSHVESLLKAWKKIGNRKCFTYGSVINTSNFTYPNSEPFKLQDLSWAYFATGNVAIDKRVLELSGLFDPSFRLYGWEDLELGERLRNMGVKLIKCPKAIGYHWHPALALDQIPDLIRIEKERAKMGLVFYRKHPTLRVKFIIQYTFIHRCLWEFLTLGGLINTKTLKPLLAVLIRNGQSGLAMELLRLPLNLIGVRQIFREASLIGLR
ncbi:glycosyltransferase family 2 protein [Prochlorococcus marinus]|uniref:glycosyltransferase family 2 protein n=1 Tax=Prochlorococcus marinus TaxID=1219 RepID=UPI0022B4D646|nr:glycosyltransferase [Prochlorococcus marinus]